MGYIYYALFNLSHLKVIVPSHPIHTQRPVNSPDFPHILFVHPLPIIYCAGQRQSLGVMSVCFNNMDPLCADTLSTAYNIQLQNSPTERTVVVRSPARFGIQVLTQPDPAPSILLQQAPPVMLRSWKKHWRTPMMCSTHKPSTVASLMVLSTTHSS
jgi:hypothetical protein